MESSVQVTPSEKKFIEFLVGFIVETNPGDLITNLQKVSQHLQDKYDPKDELNLYRKQFGNLKDCAKTPATSMVFVIDGTAFKFKHPTEVEAAFNAGILSEQAWATYQDGRRQHLTKHLTLCKDNKMNVCKNCEIKYFLTANQSGACTKGDAHEPQYDFSKSENVLECEI